MEDNLGKRGYVRVGHLVYIIIISVLVLSNFLVIAFGGLPNAGAVMGTASTVSSLILSVIAIVLSLIDVAGQRQSMVDLKETAEKLEVSNESASKLTKELMTQITDLQDMRDQIESANMSLKEIVKEGNERQKDLLEKINSLIENGKYEEVKQVIEKEKANEFEIPNMALKSYSLRQLNILNNAIVKAVNNVIKYLRGNYKENSTFKTQHFIRMLEIECGLSKILAKKVFENLLVENYIRLETTSDEVQLVKFNNILFEE